MIGKTKKILILLLCLFFLVDCKEKLTEEELQARQEKRERYKGFDVVEIDSCEYLIKVVDEGMLDQRTTYGLMSHKGNCKYCEERNKNKTEE